MSPDEPCCAPVEWVHGCGEPIALILRRGHSVTETSFFTEPEMEQQLGILVHPKDTVVAPHYHRAPARTLKSCPECIVVRRGLCEVTLYDHEHRLVSTHELREGDTVLLLRGGHGFRMLEDCELLQTRAGAFAGDDAKIPV